MTTKPTIAYSKRIPKTNSAFLRLRIEAPLAERLRAAQSRPDLVIKDGLKPSTTLIVRRALQRYFDDLNKMEAGDITAEVLALHRLA
jgi:hypothetical protein